MKDLKLNPIIQYSVPDISTDSETGGNKINNTNLRNIINQRSSN